MSSGITSPSTPHNDSARGIWRSQLDKINERLQSVIMLEQSLTRVSQQLHSMLRDENLSDSIDSEQDALMSRKLADFEKDYNDLTLESQRLFVTTRSQPLAVKV